MPLPNDITLNGVDYTVVPGGYRKRNAPASAAANPRDVRRLTLGPFGRGQRQALDLHPPTSDPRLVTAGWDSLGVGPAFDGQGLEPFPHVATFDDSALLNIPQTDKPCYCAITRNKAWIGIGRRIYESVALSNGTWSALTVAADLGSGFVISGFAYYQDDILVMLDSGQDIRKLNTATNSLSVWRSGERGQVGVGYAGQVIYAPRRAGEQEELRLSGTRWNGNAITHKRYLDSPIVTMALFNGKVAIATKTSLYFMAGQPYPGEADDATVPADTSKAPAWIGEPEPIMTHGTYAGAADFSILCSYRGRLYTWLEGRVAEFDDSQEQGRWQRTGPEGTACFGATVAGDWLLVAITGRYGGESELWGFNGDGWWLLARRADPAAIWPCPLGGAGNRDVIVFRHNSTIYDLYRVRWLSPTLPSYAPSGAWTSSLLDAGDPTRDKAWRAIGAAFAQPANRGDATSSDEVTIALEYSLDGGLTWTTAASQSTTAAATRTLTLQSAFSSIPTARYLQLRVSWSSVSSWAPVLVNVWAEYETLDNAPNRRRWELVVAASDRRLRRDGQLDSQTGRQKIAALWGAWAARSTLLFRDIDHDSAPVDYSVRIEEIEESAAKPNDSARWGESRIALTLAEV